MYYIDGYNLLFSSLFSKFKREELISYLDEKLKKAKFKSILVFDNKKKIGNFHYFKNLKVIFTSGQSADEYIIECCRYKKNIVVTSDKRLANICKSIGSRIISVEDFFLYLEKPLRKKEKKNFSSKEEIKVLEEIFIKRLKELEKKKNFP